MDLNLWWTRLCFARWLGSELSGPIKDDNWSQDKWGVKCINFFCDLENATIDWQLLIDGNQKGTEKFYMLENIDWEIVCNLFPELLDVRLLFV